MILPTNVLVPLIIFLIMAAFVTLLILAGKLVIECESWKAKAKREEAVRIHCEYKLEEEKKDVDHWKKQALLTAVRFVGIRRKLRESHQRHPVSGQILDKGTNPDGTKV